MKRQALDDLRAAIEANTQLQTVDDLKAQGKQRVRIVSGERVLQIITAIVNGIIDREVGEITGKDRERIVRRTKEEFDRVIRMQSKQDGLIRGQKELIAEYRRRLEALNGRVAEQDAEREALLHESRQHALEAERLRGERETLAAELAAARKRSGESKEVSRFRDELAEVKTVLKLLEQRTANADQATVEMLLEKLSLRESAGAHQAEARFQATLDDALDRITRTMELATAKPIDVAIEATDVLVDKLFDMDDESLSTNLGKLDVEEHTSGSGIARNLDRLKKLKADRPDEPEKKKSPKSTRGPDAEPETVPAQSKKKMKESMDRLKAVRGSADSDETEEKT